MATKDLAELLLVAQTAEKAGKYKTARKKYLECSKLKEFDSAMLEKLGDLAEKSGDEFAALDSYVEAFKKDASNTMPVVKMAIINNRLLRHSEALDLLDTILEVEPDNEAALKEKLVTHREMNNFDQMLDTASHLLRVNPNSLEGHCYKGRALVSGQKPNHEHAEFHLETALSTDPSNPIAQFYSALLCIEKAQFERALKLLDQAFDGFKAKKDQSLMKEVSAFYFHYKDSAAVSKRKSLYDGVSIEKQFEIIQSCGIQITDLREAQLRCDGSTNYRLEDPFKDLVFALALSREEEHLIANGDSFEPECINSAGDYARFVEMFRDIAQGDFPAEKIEDHVCLEDEGGQAWIAFTMYGKRYKWKARVNDDWLDMNILRKMGALMPKTGKSKRFILISREDSSDSCVLCLSEKQIGLLKDQTAIDFELLGT